MAKTKTLTAEEIQEYFEYLPLPEQIKCFKAIKTSLEQKKKEAADQLNSLQEAEIE